MLFVLAYFLAHPVYVIHNLKYRLHMLASLTLNKMSNCFSVEYYPANTCENFGCTRFFACLATGCTETATSGNLFDSNLC